MTQHTAPAKIILLGEHAVVYGQPAIAVPFPTLTVTAEATPARRGTGVVVISGPTRVQVNALHRISENPLVFAVQITLRHFRQKFPDILIEIRSNIPVGSGFGSGAAVSAALIRALAGAINLPLTDVLLNELVYQVEKLHHGTPSGIDNTVIVMNKPVYFVRGSMGKTDNIQTFNVGEPFLFVVAFSGVSASTKDAVADVRKRYDSDPDLYGGYIRQIGQCVAEAKQALRYGGHQAVGSLMNENHTLLRQITVSSLLLDTLVDAARAAGALGAKLSGGGRGGNIIALVPDENTSASVTDALKAAGAAKVWPFTLLPR